MNVTTKRARAAQLIYWLRHEVADRPVSGKALAEVLDAFLAAQDEDNAALIDEVVTVTGKLINDGSAELSDRLDKIDGTILLKSAGAAVTAANLRALDCVAVDVELRKARLTGGTASAFLAAVLAEGGTAQTGKASADLVQRKITVNP